ncbi:WGxxGxxG family protein [Nonomuraea fastidiosa]|jgi:MYXO-CTERM domain-containing protein|uniref:WGxxGxxG family protein n=1 Tax=Nonomuraea TaxID=83681 RepID=UPI003255B696
MRKTLTGLGLAFFLTLAPASAALAEVPAGPVAQSQVTPAPQENRDEGGGNAGLWGLLGLLGLIGLAGMRKQRNHVGSAEHITHRGNRP